MAEDTPQQSTAPDFQTSTTAPNFESPASQPNSGPPAAVPPALSGDVNPSNAPSAAIGDQSDPSVLAAPGQKPAADAAQARQDQTQSPSDPAMDNAGLRGVGQNAPFFSRLLMGALSGLQGVPSHGRPSFLNGLGEGARAEAAATLQAKASAFQQQQADLKNTREDQTANDMHQAHVASGMLDQMRYEQQYDNMHPDWQKKSTDAQFGYNAQLQAEGGKPLFSGDERAAITEAKNRFTNGADTDRWTYRVLPSIDPAKKGKNQYDVMQVPSGVTNHEISVPSINSQGDIEQHKVPAGTPWGQIDAMNSNVLKAQTDMGVKAKEQQSAEDAKSDKAAKGDDATLVNSMASGQIVVDRLGYLAAKKPELLDAVVKASVDPATGKPTFDSSKAAGYPATVKDFTSGKTAEQLKSGGTVLQHLAELKDLNTPMSHIGGEGKYTPSTTDYTAYLNKVKTVSAELGKFYNNDTIPGIKGYEDTLLSQTWGNRDAAIHTQAKSMGDRLDETENRWNQASPSSRYHPPMPGLSDAAKAARAKLDPMYATRVNGQIAQPASKPTPVVQPSQPSQMVSGATNEVFSADGKTLTGHIVNGAFVALGAK